MSKTKKTNFSKPTSSLVKNIAKVSLLALAVQQSSFAQTQIKALDENAANITQMIAGINHTVGSATNKVGDLSNTSQAFTEAVTKTNSQTSNKKAVSANEDVTSLSALGIDGNSTTIEGKVVSQEEMDKATSGASNFSIVRNTINGSGESSSKNDLSAHANTQKNSQRQEIQQELVGKSTDNTTAQVTTPEQATSAKEATETKNQEIKTVAETSSAKIVEVKKEGEKGEFLIVPRQNIEPDSSLQLEDDLKATQVLKKINESNHINYGSIVYDYSEQIELLKQKLKGKLSASQRKAIEFTLNEINTLMQRVEESKASKYVVVNIPSYHLSAYEQYENIPSLESRVVVGKPKTQTPLDTISIISLKYNPTWTPTPNMVRKYIEKDGKINKKYLVEHDLVAYKNGVQVPQELLRYGEKYIYSQPSGVNNALGVLKFETNSKENIYLHDTNQPHLFKNKKRANSSGCVRVQNYLDLAAWLSGDINDIDGVKENIDKETTHFKRVKSADVFFIYALALVDKKGKLIIYEDIYKKL